MDLHDPHCRAQGVSPNLDINVANVLNYHFLYLYTNAVQKQCSQSQVTIQIHSLRVLSMLLTLLQADDLVKYLPKVCLSLPPRPGPACVIFLSPVDFICDRHGTDKSLRFGSHDRSRSRGDIPESSSE